MNQDCHKKCGLEKTLKIIGSKWTINILHNLFTGKKRFGQLQELLAGISSKTLSIRLQELEKEKIISKKVFAEIPLHVEYSLTRKGESLEDIFQQMTHWGELH
jgi:DNA-binding HxlR family transcriptional regulator